MDKFGTTVAIQEKEGKGKIEIEYLSSSDLARILDILDIHLTRNKKQSEKVRQKVTNPFASFVKNGIVIMVFLYK